MAGSFLEPQINTDPSAHDRFWEASWKGDTRKTEAASAAPPVAPVDARIVATRVRSVNDLFLHRVAGLRDSPTAEEDAMNGPNRLYRHIQAMCVMQR